MESVKNDNRSNDEFKKAQFGKYFILGLSIIIIVVLVLYFCVLKINTKEYFSYILKLKTTALNDGLLKLMNANTISNLPEISLAGTNDATDTLITCKNKLTHLGPFTTDELTLKQYLGRCKTKCGGAGDLLLVEHDTDYIYNNKFVSPGVYCTVEPPFCNTNTGYVVASINSVVCRSKYPRLFGGINATNIVACNDEKYPSTGSELWDYANNEAVNPSTVIMTHENETLPDGSFRFRCKYNETLNRNPYMPHPLDRLHPIPDKCNNTIYAADYSVKAVVTDTTWYCECGDFGVTRVKHLDESNPKSTCTSCYREIKDNKYKTPYLCFKKDAPYTMAKLTDPCIEYSSTHNLCSSTTLDVKTFATDEEYFINTPVHGEMHASNLTKYFKVYKKL
nr:PIF-2 [Menippe mercenaria nudivirus]